MKPPTLQEQISSMELAQELPPQRPLVVLDNVFTTGNTIRAVEAVLGRPVLAVVFADASRGRGRVARNPSSPRVCVSGSRNYRHLENIDLFLRSLPSSTVLVHGGAPGVDEYTNQAGRRRGLTVEVVLPRWEKFGRAAGPIRNREMVRSCDYLVAFWDGTSRGTASAIKAAKEFAVDYEVILDEKIV